MIGLAPSGRLWPVLSVLCAAGAARGALPQSYTHQIQMRSNFASNPGGSFNLPGSWFFGSNDAPGLNNSNMVSHRVTVTSGDFHALWFGGNGAGAVVHQGPTGAFFGATSLNDSNTVAFERTFSSANGVYRYDHGTGMTALFTNRPLGASGWSSVRINSAGQVAYRAAFSGSGNAYVSSEGEAFPPFHAAEVGVDSGSPYSFLFTPSFNDQRRIAAVVRLGGPGQTGSSQPDEVRIFSSDGTSVLIARDRDADPSSNFRSFDNSVALNNNGWVAFTATLFSPSGVRGVFLSDGAQTLTVARTDGGTVSNIEFFAPALNNANLVAFRAFDAAGLRAVWVGDGSGALVRVATEHDIVPTDLGPGRIDQHDNSPVFGGGVSINDAGSVAFNAALTPPDDNQVEWGTGLFVAYAQFPPPPCIGDADSDGDRDFNDITTVLANFGMTVPPFAPGDANGDGQVDFGDITAVLAHYGLPCP